MKISKYDSILPIVILLTSLLISACTGSSDPGEDDDVIPPTLAIVSPAGGSSLQGNIDITWTTIEINPSIVDIELSNDSGVSWDSLVSNHSDTGSYSWNTYIDNPFGQNDGLTYRLRIRATDVAGNVGTWDVTTDFSINNIPKLTNVGVYRDVNTNGMADAGDTLNLFFDRAVQVNAAQSSDFTLLVSGDSLGEGAAIEPGANSSNIIITLGNGARFNTRGDYANAVTSPNSPSGIDISSSINPTAIVAATTLIPAGPSTPVDVIAVLAPDRNTFGSGQAYSLAQGDIDRDGYPDVVIGTGGYNVVYINNRSGQFLDSFTDKFTLQYSTARTRSVALVDMNKDGWLDVIGGNTSSTDTDRPNELWLNDGTGSFPTTPSQTFGLAKTYSIAVGDVDKDGDPDVVVGNMDGQANEIWRNNGAGNLGAAPWQTFGSRYTSVVKLADIDNDGDLDLVEGTFRDASGPTPVYEGVNIWTNNGTGVFSDSGQVLGSGSAVALAVGDVDRDGDLDIVAGNQDGLSAQANSLWLNNGSGVFTNSGQTFGTYVTEDVILVDVDEDGDLDIVEAVRLTGSNAVYINQGDGTFIEANQTLASQQDLTYRLVSTDVDNDGDQDIIAGNFSENRIWNSSVSGARGALALNVTSQAMVGGNTKSVALGDIDLDGDLDIVTANDSQPGSQANRVWINDTKRYDGSYGTPAVFADSGQTLNGTARTWSVSLGDVDRDGDLDAVFGNISGANAVWLNDTKLPGGGSGTRGVFVDSGQSLGSADTYELALGDMDGDGDLDIVTANYGASQQVWINNAGVFSPGSTITGLYTYSIDLADVDRDGDLDVILGSYQFNNPDNYVWLNNGNATFVVAPSLPDEYYSYAIRAADLDHNGTIDIVSGNNGAVNRAHLGDGTGSFVDSDSPTPLLLTYDLALSDIDHDGDIDMIGASRGEIDSVWLNDGLGLFTNSGEELDDPVITNDTFEAVAVGDLDNDGDRDIVGGASSLFASGQNNRIWLNN